MTFLTGGDWCALIHHLSKLVMRQRLVEACGRGPVAVGPVLARVAGDVEFSLRPFAAQTPHVCRSVQGLRVFLREGKGGDGTDPLAFVCGHGGRYRSFFALQTSKNSHVSTSYVRPPPACRCRLFEGAVENLCFVLECRAIIPLSFNSPALLLL